MQGTPLSSHSCELMRVTLLWERDVMSPKSTCSPHHCLGPRVVQEQLRCRANVLQENIPFSRNRGIFLFSSMEEKSCLEQ